MLHRYTEELTFQLGTIPGPRKAKDIDSFLNLIVDELMDLCEHSLVDLNGTNVVCRAKVNLLMASGDTPAVADLMHHGTHASSYGCRFCKEKG